jgi:hypothetical protein
VGEVLNDAASATGITVEVTKRNEQVKGFVRVPKRWSVERPLGWLGRYRRTSKDCERYSETEEDVIRWAMVALLRCRLAPGHPLETLRLRIRACTASEFTSSMRMRRREMPRWISSGLSCRTSRLGCGGGFRATIFPGGSRSANRSVRVTGDQKLL